MYISQDRFSHMVSGYSKSLVLHIIDNPFYSNCISKYGIPASFTSTCKFPIGIMSNTEEFYSCYDIAITSVSFSVTSSDSTLLKLYVRYSRTIEISLLKMLVYFLLEVQCIYLLLLLKYCRKVFFCIFIF